MQRLIDIEGTSNDKAIPQDVHITSNDAPAMPELAELSGKDDETKMKLQAKFMVEAIINTLLPAAQYKQEANRQATMIGEAVGSAVAS